MKLTTAWKAGAFAFGRFEESRGTLVVKLMLDESLSYSEGRIKHAEGEYVLIGRCDEEGKVSDHEWIGKMPPREIRSDRLAFIECGLSYMRRHRVSIEKEHLSERPEGAEAS